MTTLLDATKTLQEVMRLGDEFGRSLQAKPLREAEAIWGGESGETLSFTKETFYKAAEEGLKAKLREKEIEKQKQREKEKKEKEYAATSNGDVGSAPEVS